MTFFAEDVPTTQFAGLLAESARGGSALPHHFNEETTMGIRCKMTLENVYAQSWGGAKAIFRCTYDQKVAEDVSFQKATPSGHAEFQIDNPKASEQLVIGKAYYVDFSPAD